jgi:hypothetical protein
MLDLLDAEKGREFHRISVCGCRAVLALSILGAFLLSACGSKQKVLPPVSTSDIVVQKVSTQSQPFGVDVCIDATPSMEGFAADADSSYRRFLEDLEGSLVSAVRNVSDVRFFKFGERIRQITREEFRDARSARFYHEPGIFRDTNIELVLENDKKDVRHPLVGSASRHTTAGATAAVPRVTVAVTDLFEKDQDVNVVVQQIKEGCLSHPECSVGILAIPSAFDGVVFDARVPSYRYHSTANSATFRPFYLLMFGPEQQLMQFADVLSANRYIDLGHLLIIGPQIVKSFSVETTRDAAAQGVTLRKAGGGSSLDSAFNLRSGFGEAKLTSRISVVRDPSTFSFDPSRVELRAFREERGKGIPAGSELVLESVGGTGDSVDLKLTIRPPEQRADYTYVGELAVGSINGFAIPRWISEFSSANPTPDHDSAKTLNLDRLVERLIAASILQDHHRPTLARFRILIHRL